MFFLAMILYPDVQRRAQVELDVVVGQDRLPSFADREHLPYINAICTELHRWMPVGPLGKQPCITSTTWLCLLKCGAGIPHMLSQDDTYDGYFLPKGTIFFVNNW